MQFFPFHSIPFIVLYSAWCVYLCKFISHYIISTYNHHNFQTKFYALFVLSFLTFSRQLCSFRFYFRRFPSTLLTLHLHIIATLWWINKFTLKINSTNQQTVKLCVGVGFVFVFVKWFLSLSKQKMRKFVCQRWNWLLI